ncbi:putative SANT/Myb domain, Homeobox-like domain superfamily protein [Plasmopara halstedii]
MPYDLLSCHSLMSASSSSATVRAKSWGYDLASLPTLSSATTELLESDRTDADSPAIVPLVSSTCASPLALPLDTSKIKLPVSNLSAPTSSNATHRKGQTGMNGGRWTDQEHQSFLAGLRLYGREWKKVAAKIKTRTSAQIRSHAQKYFAKLTRDDELRKPSALPTIVSGPAGYLSDGGSSVAQYSGDDDGDGVDASLPKACSLSTRQLKETANILIAPMGSADNAFDKRSAGITKKRLRTAVTGFGGRNGISPTTVHKHQKRTTEASQLIYLPSQEELLAKASPNLRHRLSSLIESELCALQVLSCHALIQQHDQIATATILGLVAEPSFGLSFLPSNPILSSSSTSH